MATSTLLLFLLIPVCFARTQLYYPPLYWHKDDCRFQTLQRSADNSSTKEVFMKVIYSDDGYSVPYGLWIVCPTVHMNNWMDDSPDSFSFYENMWQVDKQGYDKCEVNTKGDPKKNRLIMTCDDKTKINNHEFFFMKTWGFDDDFLPVFEKGQHYYFISTSNGEKPLLKTRKVSGKEGSCEKYHMKLHIHVCDSEKEDCVYELPKCEPPPELYRDMLLINGKLPKQKPLPKQPPPITVKTLPTVRTPRKTKAKTEDTIVKPTTPGKDEEKMPICQEEDKGTSIHLILNFVLGGVALFMAVVIIILVCGLSDKGKSYEMERPASAISTTNGGHIVNTELVNAVRYSDGHVQLSPVIVSRTPPTSPSVIIPPYATLQRINSQKQNSPSDHATPEQFHMEDTPPEHSPLETPLSNEAQAFTFPDQPKDSEANSDDPESSESGQTTTAIVTNPRHDHDVNT